jgi:hypothetical protein
MLIPMQHTASVAMASNAFKARTDFSPCRLVKRFQILQNDNSKTLLYSWGRWTEMLDQSGLRKGYANSNLEDAARIILLYCLNTYRGDEKIKSFIWDLITPSEYGGSEKVGKNHSGLSGPVPRGRKGKKAAQASAAKGGGDAGWIADPKYDAESHLEKGYRKHLDRHSNKILLRIRDGIHQYFYNFSIFFLSFF